MAMIETAPPATRAGDAAHGLVNLGPARRRFGDYLVNLACELARLGDPPADALIAETREQGAPAQHALRQWRQAGESAPSTLPALGAFAATMERRPDWLDQERVERGADAYRSVGVLWSMLALGPGSLVHTYLNPTSASVLVRTGNLTAMARQRVIETGGWLIATILPGGLRPGGAGISHTADVRLLHARVRAALLARGWDTAADGMPLNQLEMSRTWLDFTVVPFDALARLGLPLSAAELADLYHQWQYVGMLLGVDPRLIELARDQASGRQVLALIDALLPPPNEDSRQLTAAMIAAIADLSQPMLGRLGRHAHGLSLALARRIHGRAIAGQLAIPRSPVSAAMPLITLNNRLRWMWSQRSPAARRRALELATAGFLEVAQRETPPTAYQRHDHAAPAADFPQVEEPAP